MDDEGEYTKVVASYRTAVGRGSQTPTGIFSITRKERWHEYPSEARYRMPAVYQRAIYTGLYTMEKTAIKCITTPTRR